jgi:hypothetical protein
MKSIFKPLLITAVLASSGMLAQAQMPSAGQGMMHAHAQGGSGRMDPAKMQERMAARTAELKAKLNLNAAQEGGWTSYLAAMQPPAGHKRMGGDDRRKMHEEMQALTTPQRLDRMAAMKAERDAQMQQRHQATRNFYDLLTTEQQKVFDANAMMGGGHGGKGGKGGHRHS